MHSIAPNLSGRLMERYHYCLVWNSPSLREGIAILFIRTSLDHLLTRWIFFNRYISWVIGSWDVWSYHSGKYIIQVKPGLSRKVITGNERSFYLLSTIIMERSSQFANLHVIYVVQKVIQDNKWCICKHYQSLWKTYGLQISFLTIGWQSLPNDFSAWFKNPLCVITAISISFRVNNL